jgi:hypothetical protein
MNKLIKFSKLIQSRFSKRHILLVLFVFSLLFLIPIHTSQASIPGLIYLGLGWVIYGITAGIGYLTTFLIGWLIQIASWNHFVDVNAVIEGWVIVRNLSNMFFILILLVIAFATILRVPNYTIKQLLPKVILGAILINFSKTICQLIIEFAQVVMMTFLAAIGDTGGGRLISLLGIDKMWEFNRNGPQSGDVGLEVVIGLVIALIAMLIAIVVIIVMIAMLLIRVIMLWIYIVLSPLAFILATFPAGKKYSDQWWGNFTKEVISGPVLAFFLWLALRTAEQTASQLGRNSGTLAEKVSTTRVGENGLITSFLGDASFQSYIIIIGFLVGGLITTQQIGGVASSMASKGMGAINKGRAMAWGQVKRRSGYDFVNDTYKGYRSMKEGARSERIKLASSQVAAGVGTAKQWVATPFVKTGSAIKTGLRLNSWGNASKAYSEKATKLESDYSENMEKVKDKKDIDLGNGTSYHHDSVFGKWMKNENGSVREIADHDLQGDLEGHYKPSIDKNKENADKERRKQAVADKWLRRGLGGAGLVAGALTGGAPLALAGGMLGFKGPGAIAAAGKEDLALGSNVNSSQIAAKRDKLKDLSNSEIEATLSDSSADKFARAAAALEMMSRKMLDLNQVNRVKKDFSEDFGKDKKVQSMLRAVTEKNYPGSTDLFQGLDSTDPKVADKAKREIRSLYESGALSLKETDTGTLAKSIDQLAKGMSNSKFTSQYKDLSDEKQASVRNSLAGNGSYEALEKLAHVTNLNAFDAAGTGAAAYKDKYLKTMSISDMKKAIEEGNDAKTQAIKDAVTNGAGKIDYSKFSKAVQKAVSDGTSVGKTINSGLS